MSRAIKVPDFLAWQLERLAPGYGRTIGDVARFALRQWLMEHGTQAEEHVLRISRLIVKREQDRNK